MTDDEFRDASAVLSWSGGKDSALALWRLRARGVRVHALLTTVTSTYDRISMHGVRVTLLARQAAAAKVDLFQVVIPPGCDNDEYDRRMDRALASEHLRGCETYAFGDLFLTDVRVYRAQRLAAVGKRGIWPLWGEDTQTLASEFVEAGFRAIVVCVDPLRLDPAFCGRDFDRAFLADLPADVDPCGEWGEFHTFVYDGPVFGSPIEVSRGDVVLRDGFVFADLIDPS